MNVKQLKKFIVETVRKEMRNQQEEIIKEVKAELFDILLSGPRSSGTPVNESVSTQPQTPPQNEDIDRASLRKMLEGKMSHLTEGDTIMATTSDVAPTPVADRMPETFVGKDIEGKAATPDAIERTRQAINRDYGPLMKAMEKK